MQCDRARVLMCDALDGAPAEGLEGHLASCADCAAEWRAVSFVDAVLAAQPTIEPPAQLASRVMGYIERRSRQVPAWQAGLLRAGAIITGTTLLAIAATSLWLGWRTALSAALPDGWPEWLGWSSAIAVVADGAVASVDPRPLYLLLAVVVALVWFGALVVPRHVPFTARSRGRQL